MDTQNAQPSRADPWTLAAGQHGVVTRGQLLSSGLRAEGIKHRLATGRLHPVHRGVYAVGRPELTQRGRWIAAVLSCGRGAALSHAIAASALGVEIPESGGIEVSVPAPRAPRHRGIVVHRRTGLTAADFTRWQGISVTAPVCTLIDLATRLSSARLEAAVNEVAKLGLIDREALRAALERVTPRPGVRRLRRTLDRRTFVLTDSELERRFLPLARAAGLPLPRAGQVVNGFKVDFYWPDLGLVVETDGLRYHRAAAQQTRDRLRDQVHAAAGLTSLRFTYSQVWFSPRHVEAVLTRVSRRLRAGHPARHPGRP